MAYLYQDLSSHKTFSGDIGNGVGWGAWNSISAFFAVVSLLFHIMIFLGLGLLLTFCLYSDHCCLLPCFQEHMHPISLPGVQQKHPGTPSGMGVPHLSCSSLQPQHLAQYLAPRWSSVTDEEAEEQLVIVPEVRVT